MSISLAIVLEIVTILFCINLTDPAQTYKLVIAPIGDVIGINFIDAATPRGDYGRQNYSLFNKNNFLRGPGTYHDNRD